MLKLLLYRDDEQKERASGLLYIDGSIKILWREETGDISERFDNLSDLVVFLADVNFIRIERE